LAGNYNHISNGGNREPNKGINFPTLSIGFDKYLEPVKFISREKATSKIPEKRSVFKFALLGTAKKPFPEESKRFPLFGIYFNWSYLLGGKSAFTTGLEYVNDRSLREFLKRTETSYPDHKKIGYLVGHEFQLGRFRFSQQLGIYIYSPAKAKDPVYQRWGLDFFVLKRFYVGTNLKAHRHVADFMDFRVGVVW
jgi:Lipid A 3-O-deacylase (PagL).